LFHSYLKNHLSLSTPSLTGGLLLYSIPFIYQFFILLTFLNEKLPFYKSLIFFKMKRFQFFIAASALVALTACGRSNPKSDSHVQGDGCDHSKTEQGQSHSHSQESFTVEADSVQHQSHDSSTVSKSKKRTHTHSDGKTHSH